MSEKCQQHAHMLTLNSGRFTAAFRHGLSWIFSGKLKKRSWATDSDICILTYSPFLENAWTSVHVYKQLYKKWQMLLKWIFNTVGFDLFVEIYLILLHRRENSQSCWCARLSLKLTNAANWHSSLIRSTFCRSVGYCYSDRHILTLVYCCGKYSWHSHNGSKSKAASLLSYQTLFLEGRTYEHLNEFLFHLHYLICPLGSTARLKI